LQQCLLKKNNEKLKNFEGDYYLYADYEKRIKEDQNAMDRFKNITIEYFDLEDEIFRENNKYIQFEINSKMEEIISKYKISCVYLPLTIGYHPDHMFTFNSKNIFEEKEIKQLFYLDYPYCTMDFNCKIRFSDFGIFEKYITCNDIYNYFINPINRSCSPLIRILKIIIYMVKYFSNRMQKNKQEIDFIINHKSYFKTKYELVLNYKSQIKPIFGNDITLQEVLINHPYEKIISI